MLQNLLHGHDGHFTPQARRLKVSITNYQIHVHSKINKFYNPQFSNFKN